MIPIEGAVLGPLENGRLILAESARWQLLRQANGPDAVAQALDSIHVETLDRPTDGNWQEILPVAIMMNTDPAGFHSTKNATRSYENDGVFDMQFWLPLKHQTRQDNIKQVLADLGVIIEDLQLISGTDAFLNIKDFVFSQGPEIAPEEAEKEFGPHSITNLRVQWGT